MAPLTPYEAQARQRLARFDRWLYGAFARNMVWPENRQERAAGIFRARAMMNVLLLRLAQRGFYFDGRPLADLLEDVIRSVGEKQKADEVQSLWPFMRGYFESYVARNADRLKSRALELGCHASQSTELHPLVKLAGERFSRAANKRMQEKARVQAQRQAERAQRALLGKGRVTQLSAEALARKAQADHEATLAAATAGSVARTTAADDEVPEF